MKTKVKFNYFDVLFNMFVIAEKRKLRVLIQDYSKLRNLHIYILDSRGCLADIAYVNDIRVPRETFNKFCDKFINCLDCRIEIEEF